jgi:hypothetical protein
VILAVLLGGVPADSPEDAIAQALTGDEVPQDLPLALA